MNAKHVHGVVLFFAVVACVSVRADAAMFELTSWHSSAVVNSGKFLQGMLPGSSSGTGNIDSFVRIQASPNEEGFNTDFTPPPLDAMGGTFTHALQLGAIPEIDSHGVTYREFLLDVNETAGGPSLISLDALNIHLENAGNLAGPYPGGFGPPIYSLDGGADNWLKLDADLTAGSGKGDMFALIPSDLFGTDDTKYVYLYSQFGLNVASEDGFDEWAVGIGGPLLPEPATALLLAVAAPALLTRRRR